MAEKAAFLRAKKMKKCWIIKQKWNECASGQNFVECFLDYKTMRESLINQLELSKFIVGQYDEDGEIIEDTEDFIFKNSKIICSLIDIKDGVSFDCGDYTLIIEEF